MARDGIALPDGYPEFLGSLKQRVRDTQLRAQRTVNTQLIELYWSIGGSILSEQEKQGWGAGVMNRLAHDLRLEFPHMTGLSRSNLFYMRAFAAAWSGQIPIVQQAVGQLPWGHITVLLDKLDDVEKRDWYAEAAVTNGWSRNVLLNQIKNRTLERIGSAPSNFNAELTPADSDLAQQIAKDPYVFDFLDLADDAAERDLEQALMDRIVDTLRELGTGFAFVGRQVHFDVAGDDFYLDCSDIGITSICSSSTPSSSDTSSSNSKQANSSRNIPGSSASTLHSSTSDYDVPSTHTPSGSCSAPTRTTPLLGTPSPAAKHRSRSPATTFSRPLRKPHCPQLAIKPWHCCSWFRS